MLGSALSPHNYGEGEKGERALGIENPYPIERLSCKKFKKTNYSYIFETSHHNVILQKIVKG